MNVNEVKEKLAKASEVVAKKENTLKKYEEKAEKIKNKILERGWDLEAGKYQKHDENGSPSTDEAYDCYWTFCDYADVIDSIERTKKAIEEKKAIVTKWENKLSQTIDKETIVNQFPEIFKEFQEYVVETWNSWDKNRRAFLRKEYARMEEEDTTRNKMGAYKAFIKQYKYTGYEFMHITDEEINKANVKSAERLILNLWNRIKDIVGEVTDYSDLHMTHGNEWEGTVINGIVRGTEGTASVETIEAGGYNIQKFHYRTLVKKFKDK